MKLQAIPGILARNIDDFEERVRILEKVSNKLHLDIADGIAVPNRTISLAESFSVETPARRIYHLMVKNPLEICQTELQPEKTEEVIFHPDWETEPGRLIEFLEKNGVRATLTLSPLLTNSADVHDIKPYIKSIYSVMVMGIVPGFSGRKFDPKILRTIARLRKSYPGLPIVVDGGMNRQTARECIQAGASVIYATSYVMRAENKEKALEELVQLN